jgi:ABC-type sugar transport system ATPase subunit
MSRERDVDWDFTGQSLYFNLTAAMLPTLSPWGFVDGSAMRAAADSLVERFRVEAPSLNARIEALSGGNRQKALLARLSSMSPAILLLDEPFSGVDLPTRSALRSELRRIAGEGTAVLIYSQEWSDLTAAVERVIVARDDRTLLNLDSEALSVAAIELALGVAAPQSKTVL